MQAHARTERDNCYQRGVRTSSRAHPQHEAVLLRVQRSVPQGCNCTPKIDTSENCARRPLAAVPEASLRARTVAADRVALEDGALGGFQNRHLRSGRGLPGRELARPSGGREVRMRGALGPCWRLRTARLAHGVLLQKLGRAVGDAHLERRQLDFHARERSYQ